MEREITLDEVIEAYTFVLNKDCYSKLYEPRQIRAWLMELKEIREMIKRIPREDHEPRIIAEIRRIAGSGDLHA